MIFGEFEETPDLEYLLDVLKSKFGPVEWGDQGVAGKPDAYFWVHRDGVRVAIDNLTSLEFQVKCGRSDNPFLRDVLSVLAASYHLKLFEKPELEGHE